MHGDKMRKKVIKIRELSYKYPDGTRALDNVDMDVFEGDSVGIIGPNGAGKSTLLFHLNGILEGQGRISIMGMEIEKQNLAYIRSKVGLVFQNPDDQLFMPTVFDDVAFGPINMKLTEDQVRETASKALSDVDMSDAAGRSSHHLSFGEKKRVSLATVLSMHPEILALDEPTSNLDPRHRRELISLLRQLPLTKVITTHDLELVVDTCSRVALMDGGRVVASGATRDMLANKHLLESHHLEVPASLLRERSYLNSRI